MLVGAEHSLRGRKGSTHNGLVTRRYLLSVFMRFYLLLLPDVAKCFRYPTWRFIPYRTVNDRWWKSE